MVHRQPQAWRSLVVLAVSAFGLASCIPVPLGTKSPDIDHSRFVMGEGDAARIRISPEYRLTYVAEFTEALTEGDEAIEVLPAAEVWPVLFPESESRTMLSAVYDPDVRERIREVGLTGAVVLLPREHSEAEDSSRGPFLAQTEYSQSASAAVFSFGDTVDGAMHTLTAAGKDSMFWPGFYFFVFVTTTDMHGAGQSSLVDTVRSEIVAGAGGSQPRIVILASVR